MKCSACWLLLGLFFVLVSCSVDPTVRDRERLALLEGSFGSHYDFELAPEGIYLNARSRQSEPPSVALARRVYSAFWLTDGVPRKDTEYAYLNVYSIEGNFLLQVYWDEAEATVAISSTEHY